MKTGRSPPRPWPSRGGSTWCGVGAVPITYAVGAVVAYPWLQGTGDRREYLVQPALCVVVVGKLREFRRRCETSFGEIHWHGKRSGRSPALTCSSCPPRVKQDSLTRDDIMLY